jgi:hypothetical protein
MPDTNKKTKGLGAKTDKEKNVEVKALETKLDKERELERLLKAEEDAAYERLEKKGMSDQGIVSPEQLLEFGKDVYKGTKANAKKVATKVGEGISKLAEKVKEKMK